MIHMYQCLFKLLSIVLMCIHIQHLQWQIQIKGHHGIKIKKIKSLFNSTPEDASYP